MKKLINSHSKYLLIICLAQIIISIIAILALVYTDNEIFGDVSIFSDLEKLISSVYSQSWWALILFSLGFASILTLASIIYNNLEYEFLSIGCIFIMIIPSLNFGKSFFDNFMTLLLFIPIIIIKIIGYKNEKIKRS